VWMFALVSSECKIGSLLLTLDMNVVDVDWEFFACGVEIEKKSWNWIFYVVFVVLL
jgi:hypothetical protein